MKSIRKLSLGMIAFQALLASSSGMEIGIQEATFYNPIKEEQIKEYLDANKFVNRLQIVHKGGRFTENFEFLNDYPHVTDFYIHVSNKSNRRQINFSYLKYIRNFEESIDDDYKTIFPSESLLSLHTHIDKFWFAEDFNKLKELTLSGPRGNEEYSICGIQNLSGLTSLRLFGLRNVSNMSSIGFLQNLENLGITGLYPEPGNWLFLQKLTNLKNLHINFDSEFNMEGIKGLNIERLEIDHCYKLKNLEIISTLKNLKTLRLGEFEGNDLTPLSKNRYLENLELSFAKNINSIEVLQGLPLKSLKLTFGNVKDLSPIATLTGLEKLDISGNYPIKWEGLRNHQSLKQINACQADLRCQVRNYFIKKPDGFSTELDYKDHLNDWFPIDVLKTIPSLKLIRIVPAEIDPDVLEKLEKDRPDIEIADRVSL